MPSRSFATATAKSTVSFNHGDVADRSAGDEHLERPFPTPIRLLSKITAIEPEQVECGEGRLSFSEEERVEIRARFSHDDDFASEYRVFCRQRSHKHCSEITKARGRLCGFRGEGAVSAFYRPDAAEAVELLVHPLPSDRNHFRLTVRTILGSIKGPTFSFEGRV